MEHSEDYLKSLRPVPGMTKHGKPFDFMVRDKLDRGVWKAEVVPPEISGLQRPIEIVREIRKSQPIKLWKNKDSDSSYCPAGWADIRIGRGSCGFRCRACFLIYTHRNFCDPSRHLLYDNVSDYEKAVCIWLKKYTNLNYGLGIDCSDSLLYEGVTSFARKLIPLFADKETNPHGSKLVLLTKSTNTHYLKGLPTENVIVTFSLNPQPIADLWEGVWPDGVRITPDISKRLDASLLAQEYGFEMRWRIDPIFPVDGWKEIYGDFFKGTSLADHSPTSITLGTYREMNRNLLTFVSFRQACMQ